MPHIDAPEGDYINGDTVDAGWQPDEKDLAVFREAQAVFQRAGMDWMVTRLEMWARPSEPWEYSNGKWVVGR